MSNKADNKSPPPMFLHPKGAGEGVVAIGSVDENEEHLTVVAQYNPKELQIDKNIPWQKNSQPNKSPDAGIQLEFTGAEGRSMTLELLFDSYETAGGKIELTGKTVLESVNELNRLASPREPGSNDENMRRPHHCVVVWGKTIAKKSFHCVIEQLSVKYTMFSSEGEPLRATCTVKLKEANSVKMKKDDAQAGATTTPGKK
jgi:phage protein U